MSIQQVETTLFNALVKGSRPRVNETVTAAIGKPFSFTSFADAVKGAGFISPVTDTYDQAELALTGKGMSEDMAAVIVNDLKAYFGE